MDDAEDQVVLVDKYDKELGTMGKMASHMNGGTLHRCISICIFNKRGEMMIQQRVDSKYHSGGLWSNTVCGHPHLGESAVAAAHRKLVEEMGFDTDMFESFSFSYEAAVSNGLTEKEFDHVIFGAYNGDPKPNPEEVRDWKWIGLFELKKEIKKDPAFYTPWLKIAMNDIIEHYQNQMGLQNRSSSGFGK